MAFSKDPFAYHPEEQEVLIVAATQDVPITCSTPKHALHLRHRLYALRRAIVETYDKGELLTQANKRPDYMDTKLMKMAPLIRGVSINLPKDSSVLTVGIGAAQNDSVGVLQNALRAVGHLPVIDQQQEAVASVDFEAMARRLKFQAEEPSKEDDVLTDLGFTPTGADHSSKK